LLVWGGVENRIGVLMERDDKMMMVNGFRMLSSIDDQ
jgi:hypothetical protein